ncbi:MAG TPA: class I SAM-dependent methyltransferase [Planctomycetota bacterium]
MAPRHEVVDWYDLPLYYDIVFTEDTRKEGEFLEAVAGLFGGTAGRRALEPACGSGRLLAEMARRGWQARGFDLNPSMLRFAAGRRREHGLDYRLSAGRMQDFRTRERFDLAYNLVSTFKYLLTEREARAHLECVAAALKPGGVFVLGYHLTDYATRSRTRERWVGERNGVKVTSNLQIWPADPRRRLEKVRTRLLVEDADGPRRYETCWDFRTYDAAQTRRLLAAVPALQHLATYDFTYDLNSDRPLDDLQLDTVLVLRRV